MRIIPGIKKLPSAVLRWRDRLAAPRVSSSWDHVSDFTVDLLTEDAMANRSTIDVLIDCGSAHENAGQVGEIVRHELPTHIKIPGRAPRSSRTDRDQHHLLFTRRPT